MFYPVDQFDTEAEVVIEANDGTKGELAFSASAVDVDEESASEVALTLNRNLGVFGRVSVYVYASTKAKGAVNGEDFNFTDRVSRELNRETGESISPEDVGWEWDDV